MKHVLPAPVAVGGLGLVLEISMVSLTLSSIPVWADESSLWGKNGELWQEGGRLEDFSYAGYHFGEEQPPMLPVQASVKDFGAVGDGTTDDTDAFLRATTEAQGKVILIPKGTYLLKRPIFIQGKGTVLHGEHMEQTVLLFTDGLEDIEPRTAQTADGLPTTQWSWSGGFLNLLGNQIEAGPTYEISGNVEGNPRHITLAKTDSLSEGDYVLTYWRDAEERSFLRELYQNDGGDISGASPRVIRRQVNRVKRINGNQIELQRTPRYRLDQAFTPYLKKLDPETTESGIENLTLQFKSGVYRGHWKERGFNAVAISPNAVHCWVRQLKIVDADSGIFVSGIHCTIDGIRFESKRKTLQDAMTGHHGVDGGNDCLIQNVVFKTMFYHDLSVSGSSGSVFRLIQGIDTNFDHHRNAPDYNLYTNIDIGKGTRPWLSGGGRTRGKHSARGTTFWNIKSNLSLELPQQEFGPPGIQFVGLKTQARKQYKDDAWWVEPIRPNQLEPQDLYAAQLQKRLAEGKRMWTSSYLIANNPASTASPNAEMELLQQMHEWRNVQGRTLNARFGELSGNHVTLHLPNGQSHRVSMELLSPESQQLALKLRDLSALATSVK